VCESHPDRPWEGEHACTCGGAGGVRSIEQRPSLGTAEAEEGSVIGWLVLARDGSWRVDEVRPELTAILHEIERALEAKLYYVAIAVALSVPDICACLECDPDRPIWATFESGVEHL